MDSRRLRVWQRTSFSSLLWLLLAVFAFAAATAGQLVAALVLGGLAIVFLAMRILLTRVLLRALERSPAVVVAPSRAVVAFGRADLSFGVIFLVFFAGVDLVLAIGPSFGLSGRSLPAPAIALIAALTVWAAANVYLSARVRSAWRREALIARPTAPESTLAQ